MIVPGKLGLSHLNMKVLELAIVAFFGVAPMLSLPLPMTTICDGTDRDGRGETVRAVVGHGEPESGVEQVGGFWADIGEFQALDRAVISGLQRAVVFERERSAGVLDQTIGQRDADAGVLGVSFGIERLVVGVKKLGDA